jgi:NAD(P)-dependent dehydrogenase (short-subunit alcohol dehydrogenase family)
MAAALRHQLPAMRYIVTGAASGIGAATALQLRATGATVVTVDVADPPRADVLHVRCDLGDEQQISQAVEALRAMARVDGPYDGIAHVAGLPGTRAPRDILAVNFLAPRALVLGLSSNALARDAGVVLVSSLAALRCAWEAQRLTAISDHADWAEAMQQAMEPPLDGATAYEVSKRLLNHWVPTAVAALAPLGARVNTVSPGPVQTPMLRDFRISMGESRIDAAERLSGRHATAIEVAAAITFLLSPAASWINGIDLRVDGGLHALRESQSRLQTVS